MLVLRLLTLRCVTEEDRSTSLAYPDQNRSQARLSVLGIAQSGGKRRDASIKITDLGQSIEFTAAHNVAVQVPENLPTATTNSIVIFVLLCIFVFGGMAFAKFVERRKRK